MAKPALITYQYFSHCWAVLTQPQDFLHFPLCPHSEEAGGQQEAGRGHSWDPQLIKGIFQTIHHQAQQQNFSLSKAALPQKLAGQQSACERWWAVVFASLAFLPSFLHCKETVFILIHESLFSCLCCSDSLSCSTGGWGQWSGSWVGT